MVGICGLYDGHLPPIYLLRAIYSFSRDPHSTPVPKIVLAAAADQTDFNNLSSFPSDTRRAYRPFSLMFTQTSFRPPERKSCHHLMWEEDNLAFDIAEHTHCWPIDAKCGIAPSIHPGLAAVSPSANDDEEESGNGGGADAILFGNNTHSSPLSLIPENDYDDSLTRSFAETGTDDGQRVIPWSIDRMTARWDMDKLRNAFKDMGNIIVWKIFQRWKTRQRKRMSPPLWE